MEHKKRAASPAEDSVKPVPVMSEEERMELIRSVAALRRRRMKETPPVRVRVT